MIKIFASALVGLLLASQTAVASPATLVLRDRFEGTDFSDAGGLYYRNNFEQSAGQVEFQSEVTRDGDGGALRLSVNTLCDANADGCSERAEIWEKTALRVPYETGVWFGFSVKFGDPVPSDDHRYLIAQWKREIGPEAKGDFSPYLAFRMTNGKLFATIETNYQPPAVPASGVRIAQCAEGQTPVWLRPETKQMRLLVAAEAGFDETDDGRFNACTDKTVAISRGTSFPSPEDGWIDFAVYSKPGPNGDGRIEIFANGKWIVSVTGYIGHKDAGLGANQYFKFGPYRDGAHGEWVMFYDNFIRSPNCGDLLDQATCATLGL